MEFCLGRSKEKIMRIKNFKIFQFFKKKKALEELDDKLKELVKIGLFSDEEILKIRFERAEKKYKDFLKNKKDDNRDYQNHRLK